MRFALRHGRVPGMSWTVAEWLADLGGIARYGTLVRLVGRTELRHAVEAGLVVRVARGLYTLPGVDEAARVAARLGGVLSLTSAALHHGWAVKTVPDRPHVAVSRGRRTGDRARLAHVHRAELGPDEVLDGATSHAVTLRDCLRLLPFDEALAVADSALRESGCHQLLATVAEQARGPGSPQIRRVAAEATALAANPFESAARAICLSVPGLRVRPQVVITDRGFTARADLVDERLRLVIEADSFEWHGSRAALASDCRRYNRLVVGGWIVLRLSYEDVMHHPAEVHAMLVEAVALAELLNEVRAS